MHVEWTTDKNLILSTIRHPDIYNLVADDTCGKAEKFDIPPFDDIFFAAACYKGDAYVGCFCFIKKSEDEAEVHTCLLPDAKGLAVEFSMLMAKLMFNTMKYSKISTFIPDFNILARNLARKVGFKYICDDEPFIIDGTAHKSKRYILTLEDICQ